MTSPTNDDLKFFRGLTFAIPIALTFWLIVGLLCWLWLA